MFHLMFQLKQVANGLVRPKTNYLGLKRERILKRKGHVIKMTF